MLIKQPMIDAVKETSGSYMAWNFLEHGIEYQAPLYTPSNYIDMTELSTELKGV